jgi:DNA-binding transcriptional MocR family regulator
MFLWVTLPEPVSTSLAIQASEHDVLITPGPRFADAGLLERYIRIPFTLSPNQLESAVAVLADLSPRAASSTAPATTAYVA